MVASVRELDAKSTVERRYYLSSLLLGVQAFARAVGSHQNVPYTMGWIPEPSTLALVGLGPATLLIFRRRK